MALDETLFGMLFRAVRHLTRGRTDTSAPWPLDAQRWSLLASLVAGRPLQVLPTAGPASWSDDALYLPATLPANIPVRGASTPGLRELGADEAARTWMLAVLWQNAARELQLWVPQESTVDDGRVAMWACFATIRGQVLAEFPSAAALFHGARMVPDLPRGGEGAIHRVAAAQIGETAVGALATTEARWIGAQVESAEQLAQLWPELTAALRPRRGEAPVPALSWLGALPPRPVRRALPPTSVPDATPQGPRDESTQRESGRTRHVERVADMEDPAQDNPAIHSFEKVHTLDDWLGGQKRMDGADELDAHAEALDELELSRVVRSRVQTRSRYRADVWVEGGASPVADEPAATAGTLYDEWDEGQHRYLKGWCRVVSEPPRAASGDESSERVAAVHRAERATIRTLRAEFERLILARSWRTRQADGSDLDLDAVVDHLAAVRAGHAGAPRLFIARRRALPGLAVTILLDVSLSADAWVDNRRVLDVAQDAIVVLAAAMTELVDHVNVAAFFSRTRRDCRYLELKAGGEDWPTGLRRLLAVQPEGYTRIGPAIRHATSGLAATSAHRKLLLVVTDGRPTDYDRYEGRYGVRDVRRAVLEARNAGVTTFGVGIDHRARGALNEMFGEGGCETLRTVGALPAVLARVFLELLR